jgi:hypothetical protein
VSKARDLANAGTALTTVSATELGYLDGVTSAVQTQIDSKIGQSTAINPTIVDAKGDIIAATAADTVSRLAVGANGTFLTADSVEATGLKWATPALNKNWSLVNTGGTTLTGSSVTISGISDANEIMIIIRNASLNVASEQLRLRVNGLTTSIYNFVGPQFFFLSPYSADLGRTVNSFATSEILLAKSSNSASDNIAGGVVLTGCNSAGLKMFTSMCGSNNSGGRDSESNFLTGFIDTTATISSIELRVTTGAFDSGTLYIYKTA